MIYVINHILYCKVFYDCRMQYFVYVYIFYINDKNINQQVHALISHEINNKKENLTEFNRKIDYSELIGTIVVVL